VLNPLPLVGESVRHPPPSGVIAGLDPALHSTDASFAER
jgi:hypothetical protein